MIKIILIILSASTWTFYPIERLCLLIFVLSSTSIKFICKLSRNFNVLVKFTDAFFLDVGCKGHLDLRKPNCYTMEGRHILLQRGTEEEGPQRMNVVISAMKMDPSIVNTYLLCVCCLLTQIWRMKLSFTNAFDF